MVQPHYIGMKQLSIAISLIGMSVLVLFGAVPSFAQNESSTNQNTAMNHTSPANYTAPSAAASDDTSGEDASGEISRRQRGN